MVVSVQLGVMEGNGGMPLSPENDDGVSTSVLLTFTDVDGDNRRDILIERTIRDFNRKKKWREYQVIPYDGESKTWIYPRRISHASYERMLKYSVNDKGRKSIEAFGIAYETSLDEKLAWIDPEGG